VASLTEVGPRQYDEGSEQNDGEDDRSIHRQPSGEKAQRGDGDYSQVQEYLKGGGWNAQHAVGRKRVRWRRRTHRPPGVSSNPFKYWP